MNERKNWKTGVYDTVAFSVGNGLVRGHVNWSVTKPSGYVAVVNDTQLEGPEHRYATLVEAQEAVEANVRSRLYKALRQMESQP